MNKIEETLQQIFLENSVENLIKMVFANKRNKSVPYKRVTIRPVKIQGSIALQAEFFYEKKVTHKNMEPSEALDLAISLIQSDFKQINIFTDEKDFQILAAKMDKPRIIQSAASLCKKDINHNKIKNYIIPDNVPCDFLIKLGVMDASGKVIPKHYSKFRQINRYLEIVEDVFPHLPQNKELKIIDFGCGKAYLTFALYYYLKILKKRNVKIIGLDLKKDVIFFCNKVADQLGYSELNFLLGDIADYTNDYADMVVTLHACDTATDFALINAVSWNTKIILSVPCCQHELFNQISNSIHEPMLKHGILKDRLTEYLTDGLRGLKLESKGYDVAMIEFTSLEHTSKNIMIKAIKTGSPDSAKAKTALKEYYALKEFYHVDPAIDAM